MTQNSVAPKKHVPYMVIIKKSIRSAELVDFQKSLYYNQFDKK
jgi:hypothetical protein